MGVMVKETKMASAVSWRAVTTTISLSGNRRPWHHDTPGHRPGREPLDHQPAIELRAGCNPQIRPMPTYGPDHDRPTWATWRRQGAHGAMRFRKHLDKPRPDKLRFRKHQLKGATMTTTNPGQTSTERVKRFRQRQKGERTRMEAYLSPKASWRLKKLAAAWKVSRPAAIERLILEADERYQEILFPDQPD